MEVAKGTVPRKLKFMSFYFNRSSGCFFGGCFLLACRYDNHRTMRPLNHRLIDRGLGTDSENPCRSVFDGRLYPELAASDDKGQEASAMSVFVQIRLVVPLSVGARYTLHRSDEGHYLLPGNRGLFRRFQRPRPPPAHGDHKTGTIGLQPCWLLANSISLSCAVGFLNCECNNLWRTV